MNPPPRPTSLPPPAPLRQHSRHQIQHLLILASHASPELCKLLVTSSTLSYPPPHLLAWNEKFEEPDQAAGGSHIAKIPKALAYLNDLGADKDEELVVIVDGYDLWFQLPASVLENRYYETLTATDMYLSIRYGLDVIQRAREQHLEEEFSSKIVFAAGKRCTPNQPHTLACYPIPESPLPDDIYGANTDTPIGHNQYYSRRQRYLSSAYIMGPVKEMRALFSRAQEFLDRFEERKKDDKFDWAQFESESSTLYGGSDQSIFAQIWGRQEYVREVIRRRLEHPAAGDEMNSHRHKRRNDIEGTPIIDLLDPNFDHEAWDGEEDAWKTPAKELLAKYDFGITLDYFSAMGHNTVNSERDGSWLVQDDKEHGFADQISHRFGAPSPYDCKQKIPTHLPHDILSSPLPSTVPYVPDGPPISREKEYEDTTTTQDPNGKTWSTTPLYTHLCLGTNPVMIHHNGDQSDLAFDWTYMQWLYSAAASVLLGPAIYAYQGIEAPEVAVGEGDAALQPLGPGLGGAWTDKGYALSFSQLCVMSTLVDNHVFGSEEIQQHKEGG